MSTGLNSFIYFLCAPSSGHTNVQRNKDIVIRNEKEHVSKERTNLCTPLSLTVYQLLLLHI